MLLQIMPFAWNVCDSPLRIAQPDAADFAECRVWLLGLEDEGAQDDALEHGGVLEDARVFQSLEAMVVSPVLGVVSMQRLHALIRRHGEHRDGGGKRSYQERMAGKGLHKVSERM